MMAKDCVRRARRTRHRTTEREIAGGGKRRVAFQHEIARKLGSRDKLRSAR